VARLFYGPNRGLRVRGGFTGVVVDSFKQDFVRPAFTDPNASFVRAPTSSSPANFTPMPIGAEGVNSFSSATTDGADTAATSISVLVGASSATTDGADTAATSISVLVGASSAATDGADAAATSVSVLVGASSATTDGADISNAQVDPQSSSINFSSTTTDGADVSDCAVLVQASAFDYTIFVRRVGRR